MTASRSIFVVCLTTSQGSLRFECRAKGWFAAYQIGLRRLPPEAALRAMVVRGRPLGERP
ncbi:MAG TPA: hypothetical protein P5330_02685 [Candidatus Competibacteraceae bacterium]|nr:hypothetical protein [Candidatus Competibacteraceae bacterium]